MESPFDNYAICCTSLRLTKPGAGCEIRELADFERGAIYGLW
nr:845_t:CDS:2 [Entrophospora candida]